jgi:hypothetical protein
MMASDLPFAKLRALLLDLGFVEGVVKGKYLGFYHSDSNAVLPCRMFRSQDKMSMADLVTMRKQLDWRGLLNEEAFDAALRKVPAQE